MTKKILVTGSTDGIGLVAAKMMAEQGHHLLLHGRSAEKLQNAIQEIGPTRTHIEMYLADLSDLNAVKELSTQIKSDHKSLDVIINNAGVLKAANPVTEAGLDIRFVVNTIAPYILTKALMPLLPKDGRVINVTSAAQSPVSLDALKGQENPMADMESYSQSKLAMTLWSQHLVYTLGDKSPMIMTLNPGSLLGSKMVKEGFGMEGKDINIGGEIITRCALDPALEKAKGRYFDNDKGNFGPLHPDAVDREKCAALVEAIETLI